MGEDVARRLREAMSTGEVLGICYHGGSQPGAYRLIVPIRIEGEHVRARCYTSDAVKIFALAKIELRDATAPTAADIRGTWTPLQEVARYFATIDEIADHFRPQLEAKGFHVENGPCEDGEALAIYARFKNGKPLRSPSVLLTYAPMTCDLVETTLGLIERRAERARVRPWTLRADGRSSTFGRVDRVVQEFMLATGLSTADGLAASSQPHADRDAAPATVTAHRASDHQPPPSALRKAEVPAAAEPPDAARRAWQWLRRCFLAAEHAGS